MRWRQSVLPLLLLVLGLGFQPVAAQNTQAGDETDKAISVESDTGSDVAIEQRQTSFGEALRQVKLALEVPIYRLTFDRV